MVNGLMGIELPNGLVALQISTIRGRVALERADETETQAAAD